MSFARRATGLRERIDDPSCDSERLQNTYRQFAAVNRLLAGWRGMYRRYIRPGLCDRTHAYAVLDVGCGGGGLLPDLQRWARRDGFQLTGTGVDTDARAIEFVRARSWPAGVTFRLASTAELLEMGERFDFTVCNHVLHHLADEEIPGFLLDIAGLTQGVAVLTDAVRSRTAHALFTLITTPLFHGSFIVEDGRVSIRRSFRPHELRRLAPPAWDVFPVFPFRQAMVYRAAKGKR